MGQIGQLLVHAASQPAYAERLLNGIDAKLFATFARSGERVIRSNHPAFIFGHLALYPAKVLTHLHQPLEQASVPDGWAALFEAGVECRDDPEARIYPPMSMLTAFYFAATRRALAALAAADDARLLAANDHAEPRMRERFPTIGGMLGFYMSGHAQLHLGQLSAWRRAVGLPAA